MDVECGTLIVLSSRDPGAEAVEPDELAGSEFKLTRPQMSIGRINDNTIVINHRSVSRNHAKVVRDAKTRRYWILDLHSSNGLRVNGKRCIGVELRDEDIVDLGHVRMRFVDRGE